ncbi:uncharacterized protein VK521_017379 [Ammospiza maritima maritima]
MEKENRFKLFMPPRLSAGQVSAGRSQVSDTISQQVKLCSEVDEENPETMNELFSKLYKEAEKIKHWKLTVETELNQKERKLQENRKIIEAQKKAIQELQIENEKLHLKLEDEICENKDLLEEAAASRHLCNLLKETCIRFTEKTSKYSRMTVAFGELHVQAENDRLEMNFKLKEEAEEEAKISLQKAEVTQKNLETEFQTTVKTLIQVTGEKEEQEEECKTMKALLAALTEEFETSVTDLKSLQNSKLSLEKEQTAQEKNAVAAELQKLQEQQEMNNLKKQVENKTKCIEELQQEKAESACAADTQSDSSEHTDLLSIVSEEEMFKNLYKDYPQASQLHSTAPKKSPAPCSVKSPGSALKLKTMRRMHEAGCALQNGQEKEN